MRPLIVDDSRASRGGARRVAGAELHAEEVWIAPGDHHLKLYKTLSGGRLASQHETPENSCRPAVDVLFRSVAEVYGAATLAVILTGMGRDGYRGCKTIYNKGGQILAQDEASRVIWVCLNLSSKQALSTLCYR